MATQHTHGPNFGRHVDGCSRCAELAGGAAPVTSSASATPAGTKHTCCAPGRGPGFRRTAGCPRCDELDSGAEPRRPEWAEQFGRRAALDEQRAADIRRHYAPGGEHQTVCGNQPCTKFEW